MPNEVMANRYWFLSIDEATKTLGHCILSIRRDIDIFKLRTRLDKVSCIIRTNEVSQLEFAQKELAEIKSIVDDFVMLHVCSTVDLIPDKKDTDISLVERIQAFRKYVDSTLLPEIKEHASVDARLNVPLEFIMGQNHKVNAICSSAVYAFADKNVIIIKPAYKNQIHFEGFPETYVAYWQGKSKTSYDANKKHCIALFQHISKIFKFKIDHLSKKQISHVADAVMGIFGIYWAGRQGELV